MKNLILCLLLFASPMALAQDCSDCPSSDGLPSQTLPLPEWPLELVKIEKEDYPRNRHASFCKRPVEMVDTIVLHHSETTSSTTPLQINEMHLNRGTPQDPWLMVAYSYQINAPYPGATKPAMKVTEGRPLDLVGAHAGTDVFVPMNDFQKKIWDEGQIVCGVEGGNFGVDPKQVRDGKIKANVTTIGVVIIGNYAPFSRDNPNGWRRSHPRYPTKQTQDEIARLSCQLQKKYPNMKNIKWHNYYHSTSCPGTIKDYVNQIKTLAKGYGCDFY
jgi:hypothetical protein